MFGGLGIDTMFGGSTADTLVVASQLEIEAGETYDGGLGSDSLVLNLAATLPVGVSLVSVEVLALYGTSGSDSLEGGFVTNRIGGLDGDDDLRGQTANDLIFGGSGDDVVRGQDGDDFMYGATGLDTLFGNVGDDTAYGEDGNDRLGGGSGSDTLYAGIGSDRLNGGSGIDTAAGGVANDTFIVDTAADVVRETAAGGFEDVIRSDAQAYTLAAGDEGYVERANINNGPDVGAASLVGNNRANTLLGNSFDNYLEGNSGDDILNGRGGSDSLVGGLGDDTFVVDTQSDQIVELAGEGTDLVRAESDFTLPDATATAFVENLRMQGGKGDIGGSGNSLDNTIEGNTGANSLYGLGGNDTLEGNAGDDALYGGDGEDLLEGGSGADTLVISSGDVAFGGSGSDSFVFDGTDLGNAGSGGPVIRDFDGVLVNAANGEDKLVFATGLEVGSFTYIEANTFSGSGDSEARYAGTRQVQVDQDGDGAVDQAFLVDGVTAANLLTAADFVWL